MIQQNNQEKELNIKQTESRLFNSRYIDIELSNEAIAYLVGKMENKIYSTYTLKTDLYSFSRTNIGTVIDSVKHNIVYLIETQKLEKIKEILTNLFTLNDDEYFYSEYQRINSNLLLISDDYIQLSYYNDQKIDRKITYSNRNIVDINSSCNSLIESKLCDIRYSYIIDYMNSIYNYRLKKEDMTINLDEMKLLADQFILEFKNSIFNQKKMVKVK